MNRAIRATAMAVLCCTVGGAGLLGCEESPEADPGAAPATASSTTAGDAGEGPFSGTGKMTVDGRSVNVSCSGRAADDRPVVVLMAGAGDGLTRVAGLQKALSEKERVCSYDRLGEGASDKPDGPRSMDDSGRVLTAVLDRVAGDGPVVLAGHSLGGLVAARYAPDHQDRVAGLVLMDATIPNLNAGLSKAIPEPATGPGAELRAQFAAMSQGQNPERLVIADAKVRSAGDIPVQIVKHESQYAAVPEHGPALEKMWTEGQREWLALSSRSELSTAAGTGHYIYEDRPDLALEAIQDVTARAADGKR
ncbi:MULTISPECIES: alpha/beta hydrolase [unclassified Streptomyces]|uniref:alpha/beta fold hydrolase n=1 Tax=unclassified Streptomyces TaxID=2593676 RepID=UPI00331E8CBA